MPLVGCSACNCDEGTSWQRISWDASCGDVRASHGAVYQRAPIDNSLTPRQCCRPDLRHVTSTAAGCAPRPSRPSSRDVRKQLRHITSCSSSSECSTSYAQQIAQQPSIALPSPSRRATLSALLAATALSPLPAHASKLPAFADSAWEAMGGGPSDLFFPDDFVGVWDVTSTLVQVGLPPWHGMAWDDYFHTTWDVVSTALLPGGACVPALTPSMSHLWCRWRRRWAVTCCPTPA